MEERNENLSYKEMKRYSIYPDESVADDPDNANLVLDNIDYLKVALNADNAGAHNSVFRGKNITKYYDDGTLWEKISSGTFEDLFVGDYILKNGVNWRIAGFDIYLNKGNSHLKTHHAVIIPDVSLKAARMNDTNSTVGGYVASEIYTTTLDEVLSDIINPIFKEHLLSFDKVVTTGIDSTGYNRFGKNTGCSNNWAWKARTIDLMNEVQTYGTIVWSSSGYDVGSDNAQFPLFKFEPRLIIISDSYWLQAIADKTRYCYVGNNGISHFDMPITSPMGVRPYFLID